MSNYVLEYLVDTAKAVNVLIERNYRQDIENPLIGSKAAINAIYHARLALDNIATSLSIDGRRSMASAVVKERDKLIALGKEISGSDDVGEDLSDDVIGQIDKAFSKVIEWLEEAMV